MNEDPNQRLIRELREELERLRSSVGGEGGAGGLADPAEIAKMKAAMAETEALMASMSQSWEDKLQESEQHLTEHRKMLEMHGASVQGDQGSLKLQSKLPHLVSIGDKLAVDIAIYTLQEGLTRIGSYVLWQRHPHRSTLALTRSDFGYIFSVVCAHSQVQRRP